MKLFYLLFLLIGFSAHAKVAVEHKIFNAASMGATVNSSGIQVAGVDLGSIQLVWSGGGSPVGTFTIEVSNDMVNLASGADQAANVVNWSTYTGSAAAITTDGDLIYNIANLGYRWLRVKYTRTSGTGTLNAVLVIKSEERL